MPKYTVDFAQRIASLLRATISTFVVLPFHCNCKFSRTKCRATRVGLQIWFRNNSSHTMLRSCQSTMVQLLSRTGPIFPVVTRSLISTSGPVSSCCGTHPSTDTPVVRTNQAASPSSPSTRNSTENHRSSVFNIKELASLLPRHLSARITNSSFPISTVSPQVSASPGLSSGQRSIYNSSQMHATKSSDDKGYLWKMSQSQGHQVRLRASHLRESVQVVIYVH